MVRNSSAADAAAQKRNSSAPDVIVNLQPIKLEWTPIPQGGHEPESVSQRPRPSTPPRLRFARVVREEAQTPPRTPQAAATQEVPPRVVLQAEVDDKRTGLELQELVAKILQAAKHDVNAANPWWCRVLDVSRSTVSMQVLEKKRRTLALKLHPDKVPTNTADQDLIRKAYHAVDEAYQKGKLYVQTRPTEDGPRRQRWWSEAHEAIVITAVIRIVTINKFAMPSFPKQPHALKEMLAANHPPDLVCFNAVLGGFARTGDVDETQKWLQRLREHMLQPNEVTFTSLISAYAKRGSAAKAGQLLESMLAEQLCPTVESYTAIIDCGAPGDRELFASDVFRSCASSGDVDQSALAPFFDRAFLQGRSA
ncbi:unnamed protein product [Symbiodinium necroappetens]|uniref:Pentatricopeptide repeat-containing protein, chloroplastic n=1 Tax=Symbiodinium necroappetens TaxID=1628268 RepID=A0A812LFN3_9DINO|nr:unnamed protein product [Symbiodinium necroappetens]